LLKPRLFKVTHEGFDVTIDRIVSERGVKRAGKWKCKKFNTNNEPKSSELSCKLG